MTPRTERLSPVDAAWLRMDRPTNAMMITVLLALEGEVPFAEVKAGIAERLLVHARFRRRVVPSRVPLGLPRWEELESVDLDEHVHHVALKEPRDDGALRALVSELMSTPLERDRPLWQAHVVTGHPAGTAIVARIHHAVGDGVTLVRVLLGVADAAELAVDGAEPAPPSSQAPPSVGLSRTRARGIRARSARVVEQTRALARMLALPRDARSTLKGALGTEKRAAWTGPIPLERLRAIAHAVSGKVNDVLMAAVAGAVRSYLTRHDHAPPSGSVRALVPVYLQGNDGSSGNHFGMVFVDLPGDAEPLARMRAAKAAMDAVKQAPDALVALKVIGAMGMASSAVERVGVDVFTAKASLLVTNVPGPPRRVRLFGGTLASIMVWAPVSGSVGLGVTLLSYAGEVRMGVAADARRVAEPEELAAAFERELDMIERAAGA